MSEQPSLFDERKEPTVGSLNSLVLKIMSDGKWRMPHELCTIILHDHSIMISDSSVSARLRDLRKVKFGGHAVEKRLREGSRAYEYRIATGLLYFREG